MKVEVKEKKEGGGILNFVRKLSDALERVESVFIFILVLLMVLVAFLQIILRNVFGGGIPWGDDFARHAVLWVGLIAISVATNHAKHINIDVISRFFKGRAKRYLDGTKFLISAVITAFITWASLKFIKLEMETGEEIITFKLPTWYFQIPIPIFFGISTLRFLLLSVERYIGIEREEKEKGMVI